MGPGAAVVGSGGDVRAVVRYRGLGCDGGTAWTCWVAPMARTWRTATDRDPVGMVCSLLGRW
jgi:hypothetical protein